MQHGRKWLHVAGGAAVFWVLSTSVSTAQLQVADVPLFLPGAVPPLNLLVMGRDHKLYYEAYNDHSDLDGDGIIDITYKPASIDYFGYFDSDRCYTHDGAKFVPSAAATEKRCSGEWSGDWLNYVTTSRIDALRKVLYGGFRRVDTSSETVLERAHIPQDAHGWVKEYRGVAEDGYDIRDYTPYDRPASGKTHLFGNVTLMLQSSWVNNGPATNPPLLRVALDVTGPQNRAWHWASTESPVIGGCYARNSGSNDGQCEGQGGSGRRLSDNTSLFQDFSVRVAVCVAGKLESNCRPYPDGNHKPTGLLQEYGEQALMRFGLMTGSYQKSKSGGVLRREIGGLDDEINIATDGTFKSFNGIVATLDKLRAVGYTNYRGSWYQGAGLGAGTAYSPGLVTTRPFNEGEFGGMWGNPIAEIMYEGLRYYAGRSTPTSAFNYSGTTFDSQLGLPKTNTWADPYGDAGLSCAKPFMTVISDINPSYDTDQLPGSWFGPGVADTVGGLNVSDEADAIWQAEFGGSQEIFIGQTGLLSDGAPSAKTATSFANIRGLSPEEPTKQGGYYAASVAKFGRETDINAADGEQTVRTFAVALASPLPRIEIPVGDNRVTLVPFAKSVLGSDINGTRGEYQPTNQIVDFYVESMSADGSTGSFLINFEDVEAGNDHDMDAVVRYQYAVVDGQVQVSVDRLYEAGGITHHMGYAISGTTDDGIYLVVQDDSSNYRYFLDTPQGVSAGGCIDYPHCESRPSSSRALPFSDTRRFTPASGGSASVLKDPLWYAAKWGGYTDKNGNGLPDDDEWDEDGDGVPDNYFLVTNALTLGDQLREAFDLILSTTSSASAVATNSTRLDTETLIYQARFRSDDWSGQLLAYRLQPDGTLGTLQWDAGALIPEPANRAIFTHDGAAGVELEWDELGAAQQAALNQAPNGVADGLGAERVAWLRGSHADEQQNGGPFRDRSSRLGDIVNSDPVFVGAQNFGYDSLPPGTPGQAEYAAFRQDKVDADGTAKQSMIYVGANDGMLHGFDAETGDEVFAYVPSTLLPELNQLMAPGYVHRYFVDGQIVVGDAYITRHGTPQWRTVLLGTTGAGGRSVFALDVTDPATFGPDDVLWEFTHADLGYTIGRPTVARMANGQWAAVFGNGYNSDNHHAALFIVDLETGALVKPPIDTLRGSAGAPNGLATPSLLADGTRTIRSIYAGDLHGNFWKFDVSSSSVNDWGSAFTSGSTPEPLFVARDAEGDPQPITSPPEIGRHPVGGYMLYFGTGKFFEADDNIVGALPPVQTFYAIWDKTTSPATAVTGDRITALQAQEILYEGPAPSSNFEVRVTSQHAVDWNTKRGWFLDLVKQPGAVAQGERVVASPILRAGRIIFPTLIPSPDPCNFGGSSWLMELDAVSGSRLALPPLDITEDGKIDAADMVAIEIDGETVVVPVSGVRSREGIVRTPAIVSAGELEYKLASGTSGNIETLRERGLFDRARGSWRQIR